MKTLVQFEQWVRDCFGSIRKENEQLRKTNDNPTRENRNLAVRVAEVRLSPFLF